MPASEVRSERVVTFLTPSEFDSLKRLADVSSTSLSATIHTLLVSSLKARVTNRRPL